MTQKITGPTHPDELLTIPQVMAILGRSRPTVTQMIQDGRLAAYRPSGNPQGRRGIWRSELYAHLESTRVNQAAAA